MTGSVLTQAPAPDEGPELEAIIDEIARLDPKLAEKLRTELPRYVEVGSGKWRLEFSSDRPRQVYRGVSPETEVALLRQCGNVSGRVEELKDDKNLAIAFAADLEPRDALESMLVTQMAAVHITMMRHSRLMAACVTIEQLEIHERVFNKLGRTFAAQMEALRKHRNGGRQKVTVEHVTVNAGGQAIVGAVSPRGDGSK